MPNLQPRPARRHEGQADVRLALGQVDRIRRGHEFDEQLGIACRQGGQVLGNILATESFHARYPHAASGGGGLAGRDDKRLLFHGLGEWLKAGASFGQNEAVVGSVKQLLVERSLEFGYAAADRGVVYA